MTDVNASSSPRAWLCRVDAIICRRHRGPPPGRRKELTSRSQLSSSAAARRGPRPTESINC